MRSIKSAIFALMVAGATAMGLDSSLEQNNPSDWTIQKGDGAVSSGGDNSVCYKSGADSDVELQSEKSLKIDPQKTYRLSGSFHQTAESAATTLYFGVAPLDEEGKAINSNQVNVVEGTETELAANCQPADTVVTIKNGTKWEISPEGATYECIAFDVDDSGKFTDLPNSNLSKLGIVEVTKAGDGFEVTLAKPCGVTYPAGTKVRKHLASSNGIYAAASGKKLSQEWTELSGNIEPGPLFGNPKDKWWKGTKRAKIVIIVRGASDAIPQFEFKDIRLDEE
ncbi:MAG: hypothetical protein WCH98_02720 [Verrucomicrobiota bacterium]